VTYSYDSLNRMTNVTDWANRKTTITYDLASRIQSVSRPNGTIRTINYDSAGEITNIIEQAASKAPIAFFKLSYNSAARAQWEFAGPAPHSYTLPSRSMTFDDDNRLKTLNSQNVTNDPDGNMTWGPLTNSTFSAYTYDARNRLLTAGGLSYAYSATGIRTAITNGATLTKFIVDPNATLPRVLMRVRSGVTNYYVYGPGLLYEVTETAITTNTLTYHSDLRGSTVALTDANGNVTDRIEYSTYGAITYRAGTNDTPFLFNGRYGVQTDANGLLYMQARYYNPYICRFINPDPAGFAGGLNWYAYADGNPVSMIDPFGLGAVEGWGGATATWINRHLVNPLNSVSTTSTTVNFAAYMGSSIVGGLGDLLRLGQGTAAATYNAQDGWDVAIGVAQDIQRAAGLSTLIAGGLQGAVEDAGATIPAADTAAIRWGPLNGPGPLGESVANTFRGGSYTESALAEDTTLYRVYGGNSPQVGPYWTRTPPAGPLQSTIDSALDPAWGNTAQNVVAIRVPSGTTIYEGFAAPQGGLVGGGSQVVIPRVNPAWIVK